MAEVAFYAKIVLTPLAFYPPALDTFGLAKSGVSHATTFILAAFLVIVMARSAQWKVILVPLALPALFLLVAGLSSVFALDRTVAVFGAPRRYLGFTQLVDCIALYAGASILMRDERALRRLFIVCASVAGLVAAYGLIQLTGRDFVTYLQGAGRPISTTGQPDVMAGFVSIAGSTFLGVLALKYRSLSLAARAALFVLFMGSAVLVYALVVRDAVLGLVGGLAATVAVFALSSGRSKRALLAGLGVAVVAIALLLSSPLRDRLQLNDLGADASLQSRLELWETSIRLVSARPLLGLGPDNFVVGYPAARAERSELLSPAELANSTHSWIFYVLTGTGVAGLAVFLAILAAGAIQFIRLARRQHVAALAAIPLAAYLAQGLVDVSDLSLDWIPWLSLGALAAGTAPALLTPVRRAPALAYVLAGVLIATGLWAAFGAKSLLDGSAALADTQVLIANNQGLLAVQYAREAINHDGGRAAPWAAFANALAASGNADASAAGYLEAAAREPWDPVFWRDAGIERLSAGSEQAGVQLLRRATIADPYDAQARNLVAKIAYAGGDFPQAIQEGEFAARLAPTTADVYEAPIQSYFQLRRFADAQRLVATALTHVETAHLHVLDARAFVALGDRPSALKEVDRALELEPDNADARQLRSQLVP